MSSLYTAPVVNPEQRSPQGTIYVPRTPMRLAPAEPSVAIGLPVLRVPSRLTHFSYPIPVLVP